MNENQLTGGLGTRIFTKTAQNDCHTDRLSRSIQGNKNWLHHNTDSSRNKTWHLIFGPLHVKTNHEMVFMTSMCLFETQVPWTRQRMVLKFSRNCLRVNCLGSFKKLFLINSDWHPFWSCQRIFGKNYIWMRLHKNVAIWSLFEKAGHSKGP